MGRKNIGGIVPLTPTERELERWNTLFNNYLWMESMRERGQEPGRLCWCTACRKTYRVDEWARVQTFEERQILTAKQANMVKCVKCGATCEARFINVSRGKTYQEEYVAVIRANGRNEVLIDGYLLWKDYGEAGDGYTLPFVALPRYRKIERYVLRPGEATKYELCGPYSRMSDDEDDKDNWRVDSYGDNILDMFLSYRGSIGQRYEPFVLYNEYELGGTFLKYHALDEWNRAARQRRSVRYLSLLCLYPGLETLVKAGFEEIAKEVVFDKRKFYGRVDLCATDPQSILGLTKWECTQLKRCGSSMVEVLKAHKHHHRDATWSVGNICALRGALDRSYLFVDMLCFCNAKGTNPRDLLVYLKRQHARRLRQYEEAMRENRCLARNGGIAPRFDDEWVNLRDYHHMHNSEMGIPPRDLYPHDAKEAHDAVMEMKAARQEREWQAERQRRGDAYQAEQTAERARWIKQTGIKYDNAAKIDGDLERCDRMDKRLRWRIAHLSFALGDYMTVIPQRTRELVREGEALHHCVGTYLDSYANSHTNIVFLRHKDRLDQPLLTMEVSNEGRVKQCYGFNDDRTLCHGDEWKHEELDTWEAVYDPSVRAFAKAYEEHLKEHFDKNNKKERTTA
jgi:hypothetical protein